MILHIANNYFGTKLYQQHINETNYRSLVLVFLNSKVNINTEIPENVLLIKESILLNSLLIFFPYLRYFFHKKIIKSFLKGKDVKIVHSHTLHSNGSLGYFISKELRTNHIISVRNTDVNFALKFLRFNVVWYRIIAKHAYKVVTLNYAYARFLRTTIYVKSFVVPNFINDFWMNLPPSDNRMQSRAICVAQITPNKNQFALIKALQNNNQITELLLVGEIIDRKYFNKITKYNSKLKIVYLGHMTDKFALAAEISRCCVKILVSKTETFGLALVEAGLCGVPTIFMEGQGIDGYIVRSNAAIPLKHLNSREIDHAIAKSKTVNSYACQSEYKTVFNNSITRDFWIDIYG